MKIDKTRTVSFTFNVFECQQEWVVYFRMRIAGSFHCNFWFASKWERDWLNRTFDAHSCSKHKYKIGIVHTPSWTLAGNARHMVELEQFMILLVLSVVWMRTHYRCAWLLQILCNSVWLGSKRNTHIQRERERGKFV